MSATLRRPGLLISLTLLLLVASPVLAEENSSVDEGKPRVQLVAKAQTTLSAEIAGRITQLPFREGDAFPAKAVLASFDCALLKNQLEKAEAANEAARQSLAVNRRLAELHSGSDLDVSLAAAKSRETAAEVGIVKVNLNNCSIVAPFAGRVAKLHVDAHQYVTPGVKIIDILDTEALEIRLVVPSKWLEWCKPGARFNVQIEEVNRAFPATVKRIGARIDPLSQSISITGEFNERHGELLPGMSGWVDFPARK